VKIKKLGGKSYRIVKLSGVEVFEINCEYSTTIRVDKENKKLIVEHKSPEGMHFVESGDFGEYVKHIDAVVNHFLGILPSDTEVVHEFHVSGDSAIDHATPVIKEDYSYMVGVAVPEDDYVIDEQDEGTATQTPAQTPGSGGKGKTDVHNEPSRVRDTNAAI